MAEIKLKARSFKKMEDPIDRKGGMLNTYVMRKQTQFLMKF